MKPPNWGRYLPCPVCAAANGNPCTSQRKQDRGGRTTQPHRVRPIIFPVLPPWQMRTLRLIAEGRTNPSIAAELGWHLGTVAACVKRLCARLGAYDRWHAVEIAQAKGLLP